MSLPPIPTFLIKSPLTLWVEGKNAFLAECQDSDATPLNYENLVALAQAFMQAAELIKPC